MFGGNQKSLEELIQEVKRTVIGQDDAVEWLCGFVAMASLRSRRVLSDEELDRSLSDKFNSAMIVGPTASGKTFMVKTVAHAAGMLFHSIDAGVISAEGYTGDSFSRHWRAISDQLSDSPDKRRIGRIHHWILSLNSFPLDFAM